MDPDPDPAIFVIGFQDAKKPSYKFFCLLLFEGTFTSFLKERILKSVGIKGFLASFA
jgi:hypothetical protein